jgi:hypothetical protein
MAKLAGLNDDSVYSVIRITYPEADRFLLGQTEVRVHLFFEDQRRLIQHWVDEIIWGL